MNSRVPVEIDDCCQCDDQAPGEAAIDGDLRYRQLVECAPDSYIVADPETTRILDVNQAACKSLGYTRSELLGLSIPDISIDLNGSAVQLIWDEVRKRGTISIETRQKRKDGTTFPAEVRLGITGSGPDQLMLGLARDITERKRAEEALRASEERYRNLVEHAPDAFFVVDPDDAMILDVNEVACSSLGYVREELLQLKVMDINGAASLESVRDVWSVVRSGKVKEIETQHVKKDGSVFPAEIRVGRMEQGDRPAMHVLVRDITEEKTRQAVAERLRKKAAVGRELQIQNKELMRSNQAISDFLNTLSHELRTPLTSLIAFTDILRRDKDRNLKPRQKQQLELIKKGGAQLNQLISQLLDAAKIEAGTMDLKLARLNIEDPIREAVECYEPILADKDQEIQIVGTDSPLCIRGDWARLVQVLTNLISNASKYSPESSRIVVSAEQVGEDAVIRVEDNGPGISEADRQKIFEAFYRVDNEATRTETGTGLGLGIVKSLIELHGGQIWIDSREGAGTEVGFSLPLLSSSDAGRQIDCGDRDSTATVYSNRLEVA